MLLVGATGPALARELPAQLQTTLAPKAVDELCFDLAAGEAVRYRFDADAPLDFNLHWHRAREVFYPVKRDAIRRIDGRFRAESQQTYCLMWTNRGADPVPLRARVERAPVPGGDRSDHRRAR